jgi:hypothetical protein
MASTPIQQIDDDDNIDVDVFDDDDSSKKCKIVEFRTMSPVPSEITPPSSPSFKFNNSNVILTISSKSSKDTNIAIKNITPPSFVCEVHNNDHVALNIVSNIVANEVQEEEKKEKNSEI